MTDARFDRYRRLSEQLGRQAVRTLIDRLQVLALTEPDTLREIEGFIDRGQVPGTDGALHPAHETPAGR